MTLKEEPRGQHTGADKQNWPSVIRIEIKVAFLLVAFRPDGKKWKKSENFKGDEHQECLVHKHNTAKIKE